MANHEDDGTAWLGIELSMDKLYAEQFQFTKGLVSRTGEEFSGVKDHLSKHDEYQVMIDELIVQQQKQDELRKSLEATVSTLSGKLDEVDGKIKDAVDAAVATMEAKMAHMRDQMIEQSEQLIALETLEIEKHRQIEKKKKKKSNFWLTRKKSVMAELRAAAKTVGHAAVSSRPQSPAAASAISIEAASLQSVGISNVVTTAAASAPTFDGTIAASVADADSDGGPSTHSSAPQVDGLEHIIPQLVVTEAVHHIELEKSKSMRDVSAKDRLPRPESRERGTVVEIEAAQVAVEEAKATGDGAAIASAHSHLQLVKFGAPRSSNAAINQMLDAMIDDDGDSASEIDEGEVMMHQWIDDTDHVIATQKSQIEVMSKALSVQAALIAETRRQSAELKAKLPAIEATLQGVQESLEAVPELQAKVNAVVHDLQKAVQNSESSANELHVRIDEVITELQEMKGSKQLVDLALKELTEWRDLYVKEQEEKAARDAALIAEVKEELSQELTKLMAAFREAEELLANQKPQQELEDVVDKEMLSAAIEEITGLLKSHMLRCASKEELEELEAAMRAIQGGGDVGDTMDALKESLFLMESRISTKADMNELMALKAAMKKLASLRQSASQGSLTTKSMSMCLACNRPIFQSDDNVKNTQNSRLGPANHSIMAERHRQQGVYKLDTRAEASTQSNSRSVNSSMGFYRDRPRSVPLDQPQVNMSGSKSHASIVMPTFLPTLPPRSLLSRGSSRS